MYCTNQDGKTTAIDARRLRAGDIMRKGIFTARPDMMLGDAADKMIVHRISGLPVIDDDERLVGLITEADLLRALGVPAHHPTHNLWQTLEAMFAQHYSAADVHGRVADLMVTDVVTVPPDAHLCDVIELLTRNKIKRVVVCDDARRILGIVTRTDLVKVFFDRMVANKPP